MAEDGDHGRHGTHGKGLEGNGGRFPTRACKAGDFQSETRKLVAAAIVILDGRSISMNKIRAVDKVEKILGGAFKVSEDGQELLANQQAELRAVGIDSKVGYILHAGRGKNGTFQVQFSSDGDGWSSCWSEWAYKPARDSLLHGKKVWVTYEGAMPFGSNLLHSAVLPYTV